MVVKNCAFASMTHRHACLVVAGSFGADNKNSKIQRSRWCLLYVYQISPNNSPWPNVEIEVGPEQIRRYTLC